MSRIGQPVTEEAILLQASGGTAPSDGGVYPTDVIVIELASFGPTLWKTTRKSSPNPVLPSTRLRRRPRPASVFATLRHGIIFDRNDVTIFFVQADERSLYQPLNEITLKADAAPKPIDGGLEIAVTGKRPDVGRHPADRSP